MYLVDEAASLNLPSHPSIIARFPAMLMENDFTTRPLFPKGLLPVLRVAYAIFRLTDEVFIKDVPGVALYAFHAPITWSHNALNSR